MQVKGSFFSQKKLTIYHGSLTITILHYKGFVVMILLLCSISLSKKKKEEKILIHGKISIMGILPL